MCTPTKIQHMKYKNHYEPDTRIRNNGGLTTLTEKFNKVIYANQYACPDIGFDSLQYYKEFMGKAGEARRLTPR
jgi:hypothetical protein